MYRRVAVITGMPRSGTSWVGQIVDSSPQVRYCMSPLFSWEFKNAIREGATREEWERVFQGSYVSTDAFVNQTERRRAGEYPVFAQKDEAPELLVWKFNRFHNLLPEMLDHFPGLRLAIVTRHPCGAIHSWMTAGPKEFPPGADATLEWRTGATKKVGYGDYFGFEDWKSVTRGHARLARERPEQVRLLRYEALVRESFGRSRELFAWLGLDWTEQTEAFLRRSHEEALPGPYAVFKSPSVVDRWRDELAPDIRDAIVTELTGTDLEEFLA